MHFEYDGAGPLPQGMCTQCRDWGRPGSPHKAWVGKRCSFDMVHMSSPGSDQPPPQWLRPHKGSSREIVLARFTWSSGGRDWQHQDSGRPIYTGELGLGVSKLGKWILGPCWKPKVAMCLCWGVGDINCTCQLLCSWRSPSVNAEINKLLSLLFAPGIFQNHCFYAVSPQAVVLSL